MSRISDTKRVLAIDPGTHCGWALKDENGLYSGAWDLTPKEHAGRRYALLWTHLQGIGDVDEVFYEEVMAHGGVHAAHVYGGLVAIIQMWCLSINAPYFKVPVGTIKKHATGKGNAKKPAMISAAQKKWPKQKVKDDNQADALWILDCGLKLKEDSATP